MFKLLNSTNRNVLFTISILGIIIAYSLILAGYPAIILPWYINTEEFPYIQEVLRFAEFDFRQQFFDIPGTPLIMLGSVLWFFYYQFSVLVGQVDPTLGIQHFSFQNMQQLYLLMRFISCCFYVFSIGLTFVISRRLTNTVGGLVSALLLSLSPIYSYTILHLRIEPISLTLVLLSVWFILVAINLHKYLFYLTSGVFAGLAMAARFPSLLAGLPVILAYCIAYPIKFQEPKPRRWNTYFFITILVLPMFGGICTVLVKFQVLTRSPLTDLLLITAEGQYPHAIGKIQSLWILLLAVALSISVAYAIPATHRMIQKLIYSSIPTVCFGCLMGILLGVPTILWSNNYFLSSVEMFIDRNRLGQVFINDILDVINFFLFGLPPWNIFSSDTSARESGIIYSLWHLILLIFGLAVVAVKRQKIFYPIVFGASIGILSQYGKLEATRHIVAWLPYFLIIMALPITWLYERLDRIYIHTNQKWFQQLFSLFILVAISISIYKTQISTLQVIKINFQEKLFLLPYMDQWLQINTNNSDKIFHACCEPINQEVILDWLQRNGVEIPKDIKKTNKSIIWFGDKESLVQAGKGYIVISTATFPGQYIDYYKKINPSKVVDPFTDSRFSLKTIIDPHLSGTTYRIYFFDLTGEKRAGDL